MSSLAISPVAVDLRPVSGHGRFALIGVATVIAAVLANLLVYIAAGTAVDYNPDFPPLANASGTVFFTLVSAVGAVLVYAGLTRFTANPVRTFTVVSAVVFVVTLIPDLTYIPTVEGSSTSQTAVLILMHVVAAIVIVWSLTSLARPRAR